VKHSKNQWRDSSIRQRRISGALEIISAVQTAASGHGGGIKQRRRGIG